MSSLIDDLADKLATRVIAHVEATGDQDMERIITQTLGDSSQSLQEAFIVSLRAQRAAIRANEILDRSTPNAPDAAPPEPAPEPNTADLDTPEPDSEPEADPDPPAPEPEPKKSKSSGKKKTVGPWDLEG